MKKILKLFSISLLLSLVIFAFSSCALDNLEDWVKDFIPHDHDFQEKLDQSGCFKECTICGYRTEDQGSTSTGGQELQNKDSDLIVALVEYLHWSKVHIEIPPSGTDIKINDIKNGDRPILVDFDSSSYYYICGYYNVTHELETFHYCCTDEYTWIKFENENDILEYYNGEKILVAFQINQTCFTMDILSSENNVPNVEHFQLYKPEFTNGTNVKSPIVFDEAFIYINSSNKSNVYHAKSSKKTYHKLITLPCVYLDNQYYIVQEIYSNRPNGSCYYYDLNLEFGTYYDAMMDIMIIDKYSVVREDETTIFYGLIEIDDFVNVIKGEEK